MLETAMKREVNEAPDFAARFKLALVAVAAGLFVLALGTPVDWSPTSSRDAASIGGAPDAASSHESAAPADAVAAPHVQAF
jgi:hypothetical protein